MVTNLQIAHIELRSEESFDIRPYIHERKVEKMVVALDGEIMDIKTRFEKVWTDNLKEYVQEENFTFTLFYI